MKTLVTGGAGFIGSAVCEMLLSLPGESVLNVDNLGYAAAAGTIVELESLPGYAFQQADIRDADAVAEAFRWEPDAVIHLAAETHVDRSITGPDAFVATNVMGTLTLLHAALAYWKGLPEERQRRFRFVHVSTDEVYGSLGPSGAFTETTPYDPRSPYSASKASADHLVSAWGHTYGLPIVISNCSNNYGPRQFPEKLIPLTILNALEGAPIAVYGDGQNVRDWLHVSDHARALIAIRDEGRPLRKYNVGARGERANLQIVTSICELVDQFAGPLSSGQPRRDLIRFVTDRPGHDRRYAIDPSRIETELAWRPSHTLDDGLAETVRWYLDHPDWWRPLRERYAGQRIGLPASSK